MRAVLGGRAALLVLVCGTVAASVAVEALGQTLTREPIRIAYRSEGLCPSGDTFFGDVRARTDKIRPAQGAERARTLKVDVEEGANESRGALAIVAEDGSTSSVRTVRAKTCGDVVSALALVAALAIDPEARTSELPNMVDAGPALRAAPLASSVTTSESPAPAKARDAGEADASVRSTPSPSATAVEPPTPSKPIETRFSIGVGVEGASVLAVRPALSVVLGLDLQRDEVVSPSFTLRLSRSFTGSASVAAGTANLTFSAVGLEPCPLRFRIGEAFALLPCARLAFGFVEAQGAGVTTPANALRGWGDVGAHLRASLRIIGPVFLEAHGGARFPLFRDRFFVDQDSTIYEIPTVLGAFGGDVRFAFP